MSATCLEISSFIFQIFTTILVACTLIVYYRQMSTMQKQLGVMQEQQVIQQKQQVTMQKQLQEMHKGSLAQNAISVINMLQEHEVREAREYVISVLSKKSYTDWNDEEKRKASKVCSTYDIAAIMIKRRIIEKDIIIDNWGPSIEKCYIPLLPFYKEMQDPLHGGEKYWDDFKWLFEVYMKTKEVSQKK